MPDSVHVVAPVRIARNNSSTAPLISYWMAEMIDLKKEKNFFETRVTEYQTGGALSWD